MSPTLGANRNIEDRRKTVSWYEASARERVRLLLDDRSFQEFVDRKSVV